MNDFESRLQSIVAWLTGEYSGIRSGQAAPAILDGVKAESYGSLMPINQLASISIEDARTVRISPWDASTIKSIETAVREADLGVSVVTDSSGIRVIFPELTGERRTQLLKIAKTKLEDARVSVRSIRDEAMKELDRQQKENEISEDEKFSKKEKIQKSVDSINQSLEERYNKKEAEINK